MKTAIFLIFFAILFLFDGKAHADLTNPFSALFEFGAEAHYYSGGGNNSAGHDGNLKYVQDVIGQAARSDGEDDPIEVRDNPTSGTGEGVVNGKDSNKKPKDLNAEEGRKLRQLIQNCDCGLQGFIKARE